MDKDKDKDMDMDMDFNTNDIELFVNTIWCHDFESNNGGMGAPDLFTF
jgi:hypothetical protein